MDAFHPNVGNWKARPREFSAPKFILMYGSHSALGTILLVLARCTISTSTRSTLCQWWWAVCACSHFPHFRTRCPLRFSVIPIDPRNFLIHGRDLEPSFLRTPSNTFARPTPEAQSAAMKAADRDDRSRGNIRVQKMSSPRPLLVVE
jgi:hypothetical protein